MGLLDLSFRALEVSGVELFLPPVVGASGYAYLSQVTATGWGLSKVEDFKANSGFFGESIDSGKLGNGIPRGEAHQVHGRSRICLKNPCSLCATLHVGAGPPFS